MADRLRVLQVLGSSAGGVARHVGQISAALGPHGADVVVAGPRSVASDVTADHVTHVAVEIADRPAAADLVALRRLRALASGADVVHAHGLRAGALCVLAARTLRHRPRVVVTLHNLPVGGRAIRTVAGCLERVVARGSDVVLGVSGDLVARAVARGAPLALRALVPAPARPRPGLGRLEVREGLGLTPEQHLVVTVARLAPQKGLDVLADAAALLGRAPGGTEVVWVVAGDGPLEAELEARVEAEGLGVRLLGRRQDVAELLSAADVVVSTAVWEGQPLVVQEALAVGASVVATDAGGTREVTGDTAAVLVPVGDAAAVAGAVAALLADPRARRELGRVALERAAELPDVDQVCDQLLSVYRTGSTHQG
ncbi:glycosyltransferase [Actinotalea sp. K2]|uniref:glycosyltransferase n=1 Tax=Actinotalea sp. K2 TaxID=2939438 RepID=UPI002016DC5D|nr:glycosyltransferase [Actinotalea sp. K2]MCL3861970.1 glycosyltransferase [Actinotalea sp. K2]